MIVSSNKNDRTIKYKKKRIRRVIAFITAGVLTIHGANILPTSIISAEKADVSVRTWYSGSTIKVPELKPAWTLQVDGGLEQSQGTGVQAIAEEGKVFAFSGNKLIALDAQTGKRLWSYGNGRHLNRLITYDQGILYGMTTDKKPYALHAKTGKLKWQAQSSTYVDAWERTEALIPTSDTLYAINGSTTFAFDKLSGKLKWKVDEEKAEGNGTAYFEEADGVVLRTFLVQGALTSIQLNAYDKKTGKELWEDFGQGEALKIQDGLVYSIDYYSPMLTDYQSLPDRKVIVNAFNLKTGVKKGSREYMWKLAGEPPYSYYSGDAYLAGDKLYIEQGDKVAVYNFNSYKAGEDPLRRLQRPDGDSLDMLGVVQERLLFKDASGNLAGVKLANGQRIGWYGDAPVAHIDVYGNEIYMAQRNGTLLGIHMMTTKPVFRVKTGADLHEATLKTNGMIIIQAEGRLMGVKVPATMQ
ncbi:PQQ-binding-like beta-propeller repeat protein [Paenibacillus urinalis]|uniref:PQQ-binding-like beta-propeller repeat protein n=1 Tax=Paenibacillus urinalis TaxID=521520 RepID=A0ABY7XFN9_9BACL|nr:PQQ-binding-like beta-propeller repeat protein [Paenibacillus urinalis]WDH96386.1 PQQ-binding-like beta-propeller repeat protein [Paenibacillus urinalis]WDI04608.1 PQQ-binding-like beta-propeller repeat protein [Paenibacillus urinalis]